MTSVRKKIAAAVGGAGLLLGIGLLLACPAFAQYNNNSARNQTKPEVLIDPGMIYNDHPMNWIGKSVELRNVTVQDTNDSGNFWVGSDNDHRLLVVKEKGENDNLRAMKFHKGDIVTIYGTVRAASRYIAEANDADKGSVHDAEKTSGVVLLADSISVNSSTQR